MSLSDLIRNNNKSTIGDDHGRWRQFVLDHLDFITLRSGSYAITAEQMNLYRFDLRRFLKERMTRHENMEWIVRLLNNMANDFEFEEACTLVIPTDRTMVDLYHSYMTISSNGT